MANPNLSEIVTTTLRKRSGKLADNVSRSNAFLSRAKEKGNIKMVDGGRTIIQELEYAQNSTAMWYSGYQALNISPSNVFSAAEFNFRQAAVAVSISGLEMLQNAGEEQVIDLLEGRVKNAERTMENLVSSALYSDGTNTMMPGGLQFLIADSPQTGTVGGINRASWPFWQSLVYSAAGNGGGALTSANVNQYMLALYVQLRRGREGPDLILADNNYYSAYVSSLQNIQRITSDSKAMAGFTSVKYMDSDVVLDGGFEGYSGDTNPGIGGVPTNHMYFVNTDYLFYRPHRRCNMVPLAPGERFSANQDAMVKLIGWAGNLTASNLRLQGVLKS